MPIATYYKAPANVSPDHPRFGHLPVALMVLGALMIGTVAGPIASYFLITSPSLKRQELISPLPASSAATLGTQAIAAPVVYAELDYRKPENWFPDAQFPATNPSKITHYNLSIPRLEIENAVVEIGGSDLAKSLIQYPGTANPGELGAPVIFGHSILRQFYNPKNYLSIFSTIMTLRSGDPIEVNFDGVKYRYQVVDKIEVKPSDIQILQQRYNGRFLKLVTCVPEGTYLRRGIIIAQLVE